MVKELVNKEIHPIRCAKSCKSMYLKDLQIGSLCAETGYLWWALKIWRFAAKLIEYKGYSEWRDVWFDNKRVRLRDVVSEAECVQLVRRCSDLWRVLGFPE